MDIYREEKWYQDGFVYTRTRQWDGARMMIVKTIRTPTAEDLEDAGVPTNLFGAGHADPPKAANIEEIVEEEPAQDDSAEEPWLEPLASPSLPLVLRRNVTHAVTPATLEEPPQQDEEPLEELDLGLDLSWAEIVDLEEAASAQEVPPREAARASTPAPSGMASAGLVSPSPGPSADGGTPPSRTEEEKRSLRTLRRRLRRKRQKESRKRKADSQDAFIVVDEVGQPDTLELTADQLADCDSSDSSSEGESSIITVVPRHASTSLPTASAAPDRPYCPLCRQRIADHRLRRHVEAFHLPWWIAPDRACWQCRVAEASISRLKLRHGSSCAPAAMTEGDAGTWVQLSNGLLRLIRTDLGCETNEDLLHLVLDQHLYPEDSSPFNLSLSQRLFFRLWEQRNGGYPLTPVDEFSVMPPSAVACLLHPKVLACILCRTSTEVIEQASTFAELMRVDAPPRPRRLPWVIDAHIHLDALGADYSRQLGDSIDTNVRAQFVIANYVFPTKWSLWDDVKSGVKAYATFGIHPSLCNHGMIADHSIELRQRLLSPKCVALGEIGLDYRPGMTENFKTAQKESLAALTRLRPTTMPLVVHCRGVGALDDCLKILARRVRPNTVAVQIHCFLGTRADVARWREVFPNCLFSFSHRSMGLTGSEGEEHQLAARGLSLDHVLLESDAPYLSGRRTYTRPVSPLADIYETGKWLATLKGLCPSIVLEAARVNALRAFALPGY